MSNDVKTILTFKHLNASDINFILEMIASPALCLPTEPIETIEWTIDFNKIIPEPQTEMECPYEFKRTESDGIIPDRTKPWFNWFKWRIMNWGVKGNAHDGYTKLGKSYIIFIFKTPHVVAYPILKKLTILDYDMEIRYAHEKLGYLCGKMMYMNEQKRWIALDTPQITDPVRFSKTIWNNY